MNLGWCVAVLFGIVSLIMWLYAGEMKGRRDRCAEELAFKTTLATNLKAINLDLIDEAARATAQRDKANIAADRMTDHAQNRLKRICRLELELAKEADARHTINRMNSESEAEIKRRASLSAKKGWQARYDASEDRIDARIEEIVHEVSPI